MAIIIHFSKIKMRVFNSDLVYKKTKNYSKKYQALQTPSNRISFNVENQNRVTRYFLEVDLKPHNHNEGLQVIVDTSPHDMVASAISQADIT